MTNREVFEAFANDRDAEGGSVRAKRTQRGNMVLYSYGTPIAYLGYETAVFDERKYSVTTSKHQSQAKKACKGVVMTLDHADFRRECGHILADLTGAR